MVFCFLSGFVFTRFYSGRVRDGPNAGYRGVFFQTKSGSSGLGLRGRGCLRLFHVPKPDIRNAKP